MNRLEFQEKAKEVALERGITIHRVDIYNRNDYLDVNVEYVADCRCHWVYEQQVGAVIADLMPMERPWKMQSIHLHRAYDLFAKGQGVEMDKLWVKVKPDEDVPINGGGSRCGPYAEGWFLGAIAETPATLDHGMYAVTFDRNVWTDPKEWIGDVTNLERLIREDKMHLIEAGFPIYIGASRPEIRALSCGRA